MNNLLQFVANRTVLSQVLESEIIAKFKTIQVKKGEIILSEDRTARYLYFIESGMIHNFYYHDGRKISSWFYAENQFITAWSSFLSQTPSFEYIECLEDCVLQRISFHSYQELIASFPAFNNFARVLTEEILSFIDQFSKSWSFLSAQEKYQLLHQYFPEIELRVKLGMIASFLGISQETLSRIRAKK